MKRKYTHRGWLGFCPIYLRDTYTDNPAIIARRKWLEPLLHLNVFIQELAIGACSIINPHWEPVWKIRVTGPLT